MKRLKRFPLWLEQTLDKRSSRERILIFVTMLVFMSLLIYHGALLPLGQRLYQQQVLIEARQHALNALAAQEALEQNQNQVKTERFNQKIEALKKEIKEHQIIVERSLMGENTLAILEKILKQNQVSIIKVKSNEAVTLENELPLYHHSVVIESQGSFFNALEFIQSIEVLGLPIVFEHIAYEVVDHPNARIVLTLGLITEDIGFARFRP